jgi:hypothetical protein
MKILILFQVGNIDIACSILNYIHKYIPFYNIFLLCSILDNIKFRSGELTNLFEKYNIKYTLFFHPNKGMDIGPYLLQLNYIFSNYSIDSFEQIFKIHTKTDSIWRNEMLDQIFQPNILTQPKWLLPIDKFNVKHINLICDKFNIPNIYYDDLESVDYSKLCISDISENFYCKYYGIKLIECNDLNKILGYNFNSTHLLSHAIQNQNIPNPSYIITARRQSNVKFWAGSIFTTSYKETWTLFYKINIMELYNLLETGYTTNENSTYVHAMERIISAKSY